MAYEKGDFVGSYKVGSKIVGRDGVSRHMIFRHGRYEGDWTDEELDAVIADEHQTISFVFWVSLVTTIVVAIILFA